MDLSPTKRLEFIAGPTTLTGKQMLCNFNELVLLSSGNGVLLPYDLLQGNKCNKYKCVQNMMSQVTTTVNCKLEVSTTHGSLRVNLEMQGGIQCFVGRNVKPDAKL